jgi:restriction system protein
MAIPGFQDIMLPLLQSMADGIEHSNSELTATVGKKMNLSNEDMEALLPSGAQTTFGNRVGWALTYLKKAGLIEATRRAHVAILDSGKKLLQDAPPRIDVKFLRRYEGIVEFLGTAAPKAAVSGNEEAESDETPEEAIEKAYSLLRRKLEAELIAKVKTCTPSYFEKIVVKLLVDMGYGGSLADAGKAVGKSGDEGIDGIIKEDKLGLDVIYIQAKRWEGVVGRPEIQKFVGALAGQRANKGVFITTSSFSNDATAYANGVQQKVILIDGKQLAVLMIDHGLGVSTGSKFELKKIDNDFFEEE